MVDKTMDMNSFQRIALRGMGRPETPEEWGRYVLEKRIEAHYEDIKGHQVLPRGNFEWVVRSDIGGTARLAVYDPNHDEIHLVFVPQSGVLMVVGVEGVQEVTGRVVSMRRRVYDTE